MKGLLRACIYVAAFVVVSFVPILPVSSAPVARPTPGVQDYVYTATFASVADLLNVFRVGVTYRTSWLTLLVLAVMLAGAWVVARAVANRLVPLAPRHPL